MPIQILSPSFCFFSVLSLSVNCVVTGNSCMHINYWCGHLSFLAGFSPAQKFPQAKFAPYKKNDYEWNPIVCLNIHTKFSDFCRNGQLLEAFDCKTLILFSFVKHSIELWIKVTVIIWLVWYQTMVHSLMILNSIESGKSLFAQAIVEVDMWWKLELLLKISYFSH